MTDEYYFEWLFTGVIAFLSEATIDDFNSNFLGFDHYVDEEHKGGPGDPEVHCECSIVHEDCGCGLSYVCGPNVDKGFEIEDIEFCGAHRSNREMIERDNQIDREPARPARAIVIDEPKIFPGIPAIGKPAFLLQGASKERE